MAAPSSSSSSAVTTRRLPLSDVENLGAGALGGTLEAFLQMPLITYKICVQEGRPTPTNIAGWYRGVVVASSTIAPITAFQMGVNGAIERSWLSYKGLKQNDKLTDGESIAVAAGAGVVSALLYSPVDLVIIQQQKMGLSAVSTTSAIMSQYGTNTIMRGLMSTVVREAIYTAGYLGLSPVLTKNIQERGIVKNEFGASFVGACMAGTLSALATHPVDTAKTCYQADLTGKTYSSATSAMFTVYREKGIGGLYNGAAARTARLCGAFFIIGLVRDQAMQYKGSLTE